MGIKTSILRNSHFWGGGGSLSCLSYSEGRGATYSEILVISMAVSAPVAAGWLKKSARSVVHISANAGGDLLHSTIFLTVINILH